MGLIWKRTSELQRQTPLFQEFREICGELGGVSESESSDGDGDIFEERLPDSQSVHMAVAVAAAARPPPRRCTGGGLRGGAA